MKRKSKNVRFKWTHSNFGRDNNNHRQYNAINTQLDLLYITFISIFHNLLRNQIDSLYFCSCSFVRIYYVYIRRSFNKLRPMPFKFKDIGMLTDIHYPVFADNNELRGEDGREKKIPISKIAKWKIEAEKAITDFCSLNTNERISALYFEPLTMLGHCDVTTVYG